MPYRWTSVGSALARGDRDEARRLVCEALLEAEGDVHRAAWFLFVTRRQLYRWIRLLDLFPDVDRTRERRELPPWLVVTAAALRGEPMGAWEKVLEGIRGMSVEDGAAALRASKHSKRIEDVDAFAEALMQAASEAA